jgi:hypothetical protein
MGDGMYASELFDLRARRLAPIQKHEILMLQRGEDRFQAFGAFGMAYTGIVFQARFMREECGIHAASSW